MVYPLYVGVNILIQVYLLYYIKFVESKLIIVMIKLVVFHTLSTTMNSPFSHSRSHILEIISKGSYDPKSKNF